MSLNLPSSLWFDLGIPKIILLRSPTIGSEQARLITDNVLLACEILHAIHTEKKAKKSSLVLKLDINKEYDRVDCPFLHGIMVKLGF